MHRDKVSVTFVDDRSLWVKCKTPPDIIADRERTIQTLQKWGAEYIDKTQDRARYEALKISKTIDVVLVATFNDSHCCVASTWLGHCELIFIEKPLDEDAENARRLALHLGEGQPQVFAFDHYRARFFPSPKDEERLEKLSDPDGWKEMTFYFLEDGSGGKHNGPIENDGREWTLRRGVIRDLMPHIFCVIAYFGSPGTVRITEVSSAQYTGVGYEPGARSKIDGETFARIKFTFEDIDRRLIHATSYVGKGIRGSRELGMEGEVKLLDIVAHNGNHARLDFRNSVSKATLTDLKGLGGSFDLFPEPYFNFIDSIYHDTFSRGDHPLVLGFETGKRILEILSDIKCAIPEKFELPTYPLGGRDEKAPWFEDMLDRNVVQPQFSPHHPPIVEPYPANDRRTGKDRRAVLRIA